MFLFTPVFFPGIAKQYPFCFFVQAYVDGALVPRAELFPFPYFLVVRDLDTLPHVLAEALRRWFELVNANATH